MASLGQTFDVNKLPESTSNFDPLPSGWYNTKISGAELNDTKAGTGTYINVKYDVLGPTHQGRVVFGPINITNASQKAEEIGRQNLGELMRAIGLARVDDTDQLIGANCQIKLAVKADEKYGPKNEIKGWKAIGGTVPANAGMPASSGVQSSFAAPQQSAPPAASSARYAPPWAR